MYLQLIRIFPHLQNTEQITFTSCLLSDNGNTRDSHSDLFNVSDFDFKLFQDVGAAPETGEDKSPNTDDNPITANTHSSSDKQHQCTQLPWDSKRCRQLYTPAKVTSQRRHSSPTLTDAGPITRTRRTTFTTDTHKTILQTILEGGRDEVVKHYMRSSEFKNISDTAIDQSSHTSIQRIHTPNVIITSNILIPPSPIEPSNTNHAPIPQITYSTPVIIPNQIMHEDTSHFIPTHTSTPTDPANNIIPGKFEQLVDSQLEIFGETVPANDIVSTVLGFKGNIEKSIGTYDLFLHFLNGARNLNVAGVDVNVTKIASLQGRRNFLQKLKDLIDSFND